MQAAEASFACNRIPRLLKLLEAVDYEIGMQEVVLDAAKATAMQAEWQAEMEEEMLTHFEDAKAAIEDAIRDQDNDGP